MSNGANYTAQERAAVAIWQLAEGEILWTDELAEITGMSQDGVRMMLNRLSRVVPIYQQDDGRWKKMQEEKS